MGEELRFLCSITLQGIVRIFANELWGQQQSHSVTGDVTGFTSGHLCWQTELVHLKTWFFSGSDFAKHKCIQ